MKTKFWTPLVEIAALLALSSPHLSAASQSGGDFTVNATASEPGDLTVQGAAHIGGNLDIGTTGSSQSAVLYNYTENGTTYNLDITATRPATAFSWQDNAIGTTKSKMMLDGANILTLFNSIGTAGIVFNPNTGRITLSGSGSGLTLSDGTVLTNASSLRSTALYDASGNVAVTVGTDGKVQFPNGITLPGGTLGTAAFTDSSAYATAAQGVQAASALQTEADPNFSTWLAATPPLYPTGDGSRLTGITIDQIVSGPSSGTLLDGLIAHWKLDETSGMRSDSHGSFHLADYFANVGSTDGKVVNAALCNATNILSRSPFDLGADFSISGWVKFDALEEIEAYAWLWLQYPGFCVYALPDGSLEFGDASTWNVATQPGTVTNGTWYHIAVTVNAGVGSLYVNGVAVANTGSLLLNLTGAGDRPFGIGGDEVSNTGYGEAFAFDSISLWNRALSGSEITALYNGGSGLDYEAFASVNTSFDAPSLATLLAGKATAAQGAKADTALQPNVDGSTAFGESSLASGYASTAFGESTVASGYASVAMGAFTISSNEGSTAMGYQSSASGGVSTAMGECTNASGYASTAMGDYTNASGYGSTAMGYGTIAAAYFSSALGSCNVGGGSPDAWVLSDPLFEVGNGGDGSYGAPEGQHSNAMTIFKSGELRTSSKAQFKEGVRVSPQGDLSMGDFTAGQNPADLDPTLGLKYQGE